MDTRYTVKQIEDQIWQIDDEVPDTDSAYLVAGSKKAVLVDTTMGKESLRQVVRSLTELPVEVALTHGHWDHCAHADEFPVIYVHPGDYEMLIHTWKDRGIDYRGRISLILEGDSIDLGGRRLDVLALQGHTPGSVVFLEAESGSLFCGDAFGSGSGVLMAVGSTPACLSSYKAALERFLHKIEGKGFRMYGGHGNQVNGIPGLQDFANPMSEELLEDMILLCEKIIRRDGSLVWREQKDSHVMWKMYYVSSGKAAMWVTKEQSY